MVTLVGYACFGLAGLFLLGWVWMAVKGQLSSVVPSSVVDVIDNVSDYADQTAAGAALGTLVLLFKKHGDTETISVLGTLWTKAMAWDDPPAQPSTDATVKTLQAKVAALEAAAKP